MPRQPSEPGARLLTFAFPAVFIEHLDRQAMAQDRTRAAYLRELIRQDIQRLQQSDRP